MINVPVSYKVPISSTTSSSSTPTSKFKIFTKLNFWSARIRRNLRNPRLPTTTITVECSPYWHPCSWQMVQAQPTDTSSLARRVINERWTKEKNERHPYTNQSLALSPRPQEHTWQQETQCQIYCTLWNFTPVTKTSYRNPQDFPNKSWRGLDKDTEKYQNKMCHGLCYTLGKVHGLLSSDTEVEFCCVPHLVSVAAHFYPVTNRMTVHSIHHVALIVHTLAIMMWAITWIQSKPLLEIKWKDVIFSFSHYDYSSGPWIYFWVQILYGKD